MSDDGGRRVLAPFGRRTAAVTANETVGAYTVLHVADPAGPLPWPGQFYMLAAVQRWGAGDDERPYLPRALSYLRASDEAGGVGLQFLLEDVGPGTGRLAELGAGEELWLAGPLGLGFELPVEGAGLRALLCGGGVGIAPIAALQDRLGDGAGAALLGFRDAAHAEGARLLRNVRLATDDGSAGHAGRVTDLLAAELDADPAAVVFACGPPPMLETVRAMAAERGVRAQLALEAGMACGFGACYGCVVATVDGFKRVCVDGPVMEADALESALAAGIGH